MKRIFLILLFLLGLLIVSDIAFAQCSMCKAVIENNQGDIGKGINNAILYIMIMPYILLATIAIIFFRKKIVEKLNK